MYRELRVYTVKPGAMDAWLRERRELVYPLRLRLGFSIPAARVVVGENRFVWLVLFARASGQRTRSSPRGAVRRSVPTARR